MIYDCFTYNGEKELFDLRYNILKDRVDVFLMVEFSRTFTGIEKSFFSAELDMTKYPKLQIYQVFEDHWLKYRKMAEASPNTAGADHWKREFMQKECIKDALEFQKVLDEDIIFIGDCDEVWHPEISLLPDPTEDEKRISYTNGTAKIKLRVYSYYLNLRTNEEFHGTLVGKWKYIKNECLNHLRTNPTVTKGGEGWHFTSMGGLEEVRRKLESSYNAESYYTDEVKAKLEERFGKADYIGRDFKFWVDESEWPEYLKLNKEKYEQMLYHNSGV